MKTRPDRSSCRASLSVRALLRCTRIPTYSGRLVDFLRLDRPFFSEREGTSAKALSSRARASYRFVVDFPDSTFAALNLVPEEPLSWGRMLVLALVLTVAAASAGILAGTLSF